MNFYDTPEEHAELCSDISSGIVSLRYPRLPLADLFGYAHDHMIVVGWQLVRAVMQDVQQRKEGDRRTMMRVTL